MNKYCESCRKNTPAYGHAYCRPCKRLHKSKQGYCNKCGYKLRKCYGVSCGGPPCQCKYCVGIYESMYCGLCI